METKRKTLWAVLAALFAAYAALMLCLLFDRPAGPAAVSCWEQVRWSVNLVPFRTIREFWAVLRTGEGGYLARHAVINLAGNVVMFVPLGFFLPRLWRSARRLHRTLLRAAGVILAIEIAQPLTLRGSGDIDDLILNLAGTALGYGLFALGRQLSARRGSTEGL